MQIRAKLYIATVLTAGALSLAYAMAGWNCADPLHYVCQLAIALVASGLKVTLPGILSTMSVSYVFVVLSMMEFSYPETVALACMATAVQCLWRPKYPPKLLQLAFNVASMAIAVSTGYGIYHMLPGRQPGAAAARGTGGHRLLSHQHALGGGGGFRHRRQEPAPHLEGVLLLVLSLLSGGRRDCRPDQHLQPPAGLADHVSRTARGLRHFPVVPALPGPAGVGEGARPGNRGPAPAHHRGAGAGHRSQGRKHPRASAAGAGLRGGDGQAGWGWRKATCRRCARPPSCTTSASWRCRSISSRNPES